MTHPGPHATSKRLHPRLTVVRASTEARARLRGHRDDVIDARALQGRAEGLATERSVSRSSIRNRLEAAVGRAAHDLETAQAKHAALIALERDLWVLMAELATDLDHREKLIPGGSLVTDEMVTRLGELADDIGARFELPREFVVPGQDRASALLDLARTVARRAERAATAVAVDGSHVVPYLNRLSSVLWTLARWVEGEPLTAKGA